MADPVSAAIKAVVSAYKICEGIYSVADGMKKAPADIRRVVTEMTEFYKILGPLQTTITNSRQLLQDGVAAQQLDNITTLIEHSVLSFQEAQEVVSDYIAINGNVIAGLFEAWKWHQFAKDNVRHMLDHLATLKLSLNLTLSSLNFVIGITAAQQAAEWHREIRADIASLRARLLEEAEVDISSTNVPAVRDSMFSVISIASRVSNATIVSMHESIEDFLQRTELTIEPLNEPSLPHSSVPERAFVTIKLDSGPLSSVTLIIFTISSRGHSFVLHRSLNDFYNLHNGLVDVKTLHVEPSWVALAGLLNPDEHEHLSQIATLFCTAARFDDYLQRLLRSGSALRDSSPMRDFFRLQGLDDHKMVTELCGEVLDADGRHGALSDVQNVPSFRCKATDGVMKMAEIYKWLGVITHPSASESGTMYAVAWAIDRKDEKCDSSTTRRLQAATHTNVLKAAPLDLRISNRVDRAHTNSYVVVVWSREGLTWQVRRTQQDYYDLQSVLNKTFGKDDQAQIHDIPQPLEATKSVDVTSELRCFLASLLKRRKSTMSTLHVRRFFAPAEGDSEMSHSTVQHYNLLVDSSFVPASRGRIGSADKQFRRTS